MQKLELKKYSFGWCGEHTQELEIVRRTEKSVWFIYEGKEARAKIKVDPANGGTEFFFPVGNYSQCPVVHGDD